MSHDATYTGTEWELRELKLTVARDILLEDTGWVCSTQWELSRKFDAFGLALTVEAFHKVSGKRIARVTVHGMYRFDQPVPMEMFLAESVKPRSFFERMIIDVLGFARGVILQKCEEQDMPQLIVPMFDFTSLLPAKRIPDWRLN